MEISAFQQIKSEFKDASLEKKIDMYISTEGLTQTQYRELLSLFPINELDKLESALS